MTPEQIYRAAMCPMANVERNWPFIVDALIDAGIDSPMVQVAAAATVAVETGSFTPIKERHASRERQPALWAIQEKYWGDGFMGRGFIQLTHRRNYEFFGAKLGVDLVNEPDSAMDPCIAARVLAEYFKENHVDDAANAKDWRRVRRLVNGGYIGYDTFIKVVNNLLEAP